MRSWRILIALFPVLLASCSSVPVASGETIDPPQANLVALCPAPPPLPAKDPLLLGDLVEADAELARQYLECARRHEGLVEWARGVTKRRQQ